MDRLTEIDHVITMEDIAFGERVRTYVIEGNSGDHWFEIARGISIGHKRIDRCKSVKVNRVRLRCLKSAASPVIRKLSVYMVGDEKEYNKLTSETDGFGNAWGIGETKKYKDLENLGKLTEQVEENGSYRIDLSGVIDIPGQYEMFVSMDDSKMPLRLESSGIWLEGIETPGFCKVNKIYNRMEVNITGVPTREEGSIVVRFKLADTTSDEENLFLRKVVFD